MSDDALGIGTQVGDYELIEPLGRGAMGMVWKAWSPARSQVVALKLLRVVDHDVVDRAVREGHVQARIQSDHVVELYEVFVHRRSPVLAMEYVSGVTLLDMLQQRRLSLLEADELARGLFRGLAASHQEGVIHRDIKPANVLVPAGDGPLQPKLADFGLARIEGVVGGLTAIDVLLGTAGYMAPEQIGDPRTAGVPADLFSLGVVLYRIVTGRLPYQSARRADVLARTLAGRHTPVIDLRPEAPERMIAAIESALRSNPSERPASVDAFRGIWDGIAEPPTFVEPAEERVSSQAPVDPPSGVPSSNVVRPPQALCGRQIELAQLESRLVDWPLTTLLGLGGVGKTRLAVEAALEHRARGGSAWLVDLSEANDLVTLCTAVAAAMGGRVDGEAPVASVAKTIADSTRPLVVLDHAEGVARHLADTITTWAGVAPEARFLITTRRHLGLPGELLIELGPLTSDAAVALFEQQAQRVKPVFSLAEDNRGAVVELVARLDHLPLAIEIAASRVRLLPPARLLERLGPRLGLLRRGASPSRLDTVLQWSWDQLPDWGRAALGACTVFRGGFTLEAADAVLGPILSGVDGAPWPMDAIQVLVDHCLVRVSEPLSGVERFLLPATVRAFAAEQRVDDDAALRHARFYGALGRTDRMKPLTGRQGRLRTRLLALERANLRAGARRAITRSEPEVAAGCTLAWAWLARTHGPYDVSLLQQILLQNGLAAETTARLYRSLGLLRRLSGRLEDALSAYGEAADRFAALCDARREGLARGNMADVLSDLGRDGQSVEAYGRSLALLAGRHRASEAVIGGNLANLLRRMGDPAGAERAYRSALTISRQLGDQRAVGMTQANLASLLMDQGRLDQAEVAYAAALTTAEALDDTRTEGLLRGNLGLLRRAQGDDDGATSEFEASIALARQVGHCANECLACGNLGDLLLDRGDLPGAEEQLAIAVALGDRALPLAAGAFRGSLGELRIRQGDRAGGMALLAEAEAALDGRDPVELAKVRARRARLDA